MTKKLLWLKKACIVKEHAGLHSERACRHDKIIVNKSGIVEELATLHDNKKIVVVKSLHSERACRHDKIIVNKSGIVEELATLHDNIKIVVVKKSLHSERACRSA